MLVLAKLVNAPHNGFTLLAFENPSEHFHNKFEPSLLQVLSAVSFYLPSYISTGTNPYILPPHPFLENSHRQSSWSRANL